MAVDRGVVAVTHVLRLGVELLAGHQHHALTECTPELLLHLQSRLEIPVIGEGEEIHAEGPPADRDIRGLLAAVRSGGVGVQLTDVGSVPVPLLCLCEEPELAGEIPRLDLLGVDGELPLAEPVRREGDDESAVGIGCDRAGHRLLEPRPGGVVEGRLKLVPVLHTLLEAGVQVVAGDDQLPAPSRRHDPREEAVLATVGPKGRHMRRLLYRG